ncbi:MAG TPA: Rne/Rng family ribonuclease [Acetobacteraceae bacterium]|nr:Rne/Rng family ribonuclease [Acetobacteraceae bacterium]
MTKRMLIDATHAEETRVVVLDGSRLEDYDVETATKKQLKGNIYLAKVVRVEPSLQAAFVEYGGNRHGFLAFAEIHPDYYQIPIADRQKLLAMQEEEARVAEEEEEAEEARQAAASVPAAVPVEAPGEEPGEEPAASVEEAPAGEADEAGEAPPGEAPAGEEASLEAEAPPPETVGGESEGSEDFRPQRMPTQYLRQYKIQEVVHRRQILLVQVVKEERGAKGAALTTYISLAGRYCVLMPNSPRGGGISRKITSPADRRRLKEAVAELSVPAGMGLIVRTAGAMRPKPEIKRDCEYLLRLWDEIRETVMKSVAPALIYEEASLIKRAIRDVYSRDIEEVLVDGEAGWQAARDFMRMLMPTHARKVQLWKDPAGRGLFAHEHVEAELDAVLSPVVPLRSGGSLVINQTEALVAIDVNSGRSTRERNVEETALRTDLEAAEEAARQLRLRDLAGLIVIDFIDMESRKHNGMVERRLKEALKNDRARVQVGHISHFGLLEMSRQRLRPSLAETSFLPCPHCDGTGHVRSVESAAIRLLRLIEDEASRKHAGELLVHASGPVALYVFNHKRAWLAEIEGRHGISIRFAVEEHQPVSFMRIERPRGAAVVAEAPAGAQAAAVPAAAAPALAAAVPAAAALAASNGEAKGEEDEEAGEAEEATAEAAAPQAGAAEETEEGERRRRRRRRRRRHREDGTAVAAAPGVAEGVPPEQAEQPEIGPRGGPEAGPGVGGMPERTAREAPPRGRGPRGGARGGAREAGRDGGRGRGARPPAGPAPLGPIPARPAPAAAPSPPAALPEARPYPARPTPADPFADAALDFLDALEAAAESAIGPPPGRPYRAEPQPEAIEEVAAEAVARPEERAEASVFAAPPSEAVSVAADGAREVPVREPGAEEAGPVEAPTDDRPPEPAVKPIVIGADEAEALPKKRGWWQR